MYGARTHITSLSSAASHICIKRGGTTETYWPDSTGARAALGGMVVSDTNSEILDWGCNRYVAGTGFRETYCIAC